MDNIGNGKGGAGNQRNRAASDHGLLSEDISIEDLTVMKLMEEIMELQEEIKLKQKFVSTRMRMLEKIVPKQKNQTATIATEFMMRITRENPNMLPYPAQEAAEQAPQQVQNQEEEQKDAQ